MCKELKVCRRRTILYEDNQTAIKVIEANTEVHTVKSVDLTYHKIQDYVEKHEFALVYCPSEEMLAEIFFKPFGPTLFKKLRQMLNIIPVPTVALVQ